MKRINKNSLPFILLSFIHLLLLLYTLLKKRERQTITLLLSNISFAYIFEYFVFNIFSAYRYNPKLLKKRHLDNAVGALLSQAVYVPIAATFISVFQLGWVWKTSITAYFHIVELIFLRTGNYKLNWWKPVYTVTLLPIYFASSDYWNRNLTSGKKSFLWLSTFLSVGVITKTLAFLLDIKKNSKIGIGRRHTWKEHFLISPLYMFVFSITAMLPAASRKPITKLFTFLLMLLLNYVLSLIKVINNKTIFLQTAALNLFMVFLAPKMQAFIFANKKKTETTPG